MNPDEFEKELEHLLNKWGKDNEADTPDFILARMLTEFLSSYIYCQLNLRHWKNQDANPR